MLKVDDLKVFVPAKDFAVSKRFYQQLGMELVWESDGLCQMTISDCSFLLQDYYQKDWADNFMLQLCVEDIGEAWQHLQSCGILEGYDGVSAHAPKQEPWGKVIYLIGPSGELWHLTEYPE